MFAARNHIFPGFDTMRNPFGMFDRVFGSRRNQRAFPAVNIHADETGAVLTSELPGVKMEELEITVSGRQIVLKGERAAEEMPENGKHVRRERNAGPFERAMQLPFAIDANKVEAKFTNGVLEVVLPRAESEKPRKIEIQG